MGRHCPARMVLEIRTDHLTVDFTYTHFGHDLEAKHLRMTEETQETIRSQLQLGIPKEIVNRNVRKHYTPRKTLRRSNLLTLPDVRNTARKFRIDFEGQLHSDDPVGIDLFVQEQLGKKEAIILSYKKQGIVDANFPSLGEMDFMLALMTPFQKKMVQQLQSQEKSVICMDATHQTNGYNFLLVTILTKDNSAQSLPLAHLFTNREDYSVGKKYLRKVESSCLISIRARNGKSE